jgi:hypothetical protein
MLLGENDTPTFLFKQHEKVQGLYIYIYPFNHPG